MRDRISFRVERGLFVITINDPLKLNSLSFNDFNHIASLLEISERSEDSAITVIQSTGSFFSAGGKLEVVDAGSNLSSGELVKEISAPNVYVANAFATHPKLLVCCLNGPAVGLAASMVLLCDMVFAINDSVYLSFPFSALGFVPELSSSVTLPWKLGLNSSFDHFVFSSPIGFKELLASGIINKSFNNRNHSEGSKMSKLFNEQCIEILVPLCEAPSSVAGIKALLSTCQPQHREWLAQAQSREVVTTLPFWINGEPFKRFKELMNRKQSKL